jgi:hypothetical protein
MMAATETWMNLPSVQRALHVKSSAFIGHSWQADSYDAINYTDYSLAAWDLWPKILPRYRTLIYSGDLDACVPYVGTEDWTSRMAQLLNITGTGTALEGTVKQIPDQGWRPWIVNSTGGRKGGSVAGYVTDYELAGVHNFTFLTVREAGHMVPQYQPVRALALFTRWLHGEPY